jgi:hypothetical protein
LDDHRRKIQPLDLPKEAEDVSLSSVSGSPATPKKRRKHHSKENSAPATTNLAASTTSMTSSESSSPTGFVDEVVELNVGGRLFVTTKGTLTRNGTSDNYFTALLNGKFKKLVDPRSGAIFIDRDPDMFDLLLQYLRNGEFRAAPPISEDMLKREAQFYQIDIPAALDRRPSTAEQASVVTLYSKITFNNNRNLFDAVRSCQAYYGDHARRSLPSSMPLNVEDARNIERYLNLGYELVSTTSFVLQERGPRIDPWGKSTNDKKEQDVSELEAVIIRDVLVKRSVVPAEPPRSPRNL